MNILVGKGITISQSNTQQTHEESNSPQVPLSPEIKTMIRRKISSYLNYHLQLSPQISKQITVVKKAKPPLPKEYPSFTSLLEYFKEEKLVYHLYKEKIDRNLDQCQFFFFKTLSLVIDYECRVSAKELDRQASIMIDAFLFLASSLLEVGADKAAFYFANIGLQFCEYCKVLRPIGQFLLIAAKISRKQFRYRESILMLKKALEYNWWKDKSRSEQLNEQFIQWLALNSPDQVEIYQEKYEVGRLFGPQEQQKTMKMYRSVSVSKDLDCGVFRDFFQQFLEGNKIRLENLKYDVQLKKGREVRSQQSNDLQIAIYNQLSFNFLQLNMKEESKIFAQKYQSGYLEPEESKIKALSSQLIHSVQKRISGWHRINRKSFELLLYVDLFQVLHNHRAEMRSLDQQNIMQLFKINYESTFDALLRKDMFSYEIPLPLEIRRDIPKMKKKSDGRKFIVKQRSISHMGKGPVQIIRDKFTSDKVEQNLLLNFRGIGVSRLKLLDIYSRLLEAIRSKEKQGCFKMVNWAEKS